MTNSGIERGLSGVPGQGQSLTFSMVKESQRLGNDVMGQGMGS